MRTRHRDALDIQRGACNPIAISNTLVDHMKRMSADPNVGFDTLRKDPALRLMVHQLAHLFDVASILDMDDYRKMTKACERATLRNREDQK